MPKLEPKAVQKDLEQGLLWPVYWIYGQERMKSRELLKRIRKSVLGDGTGQEASLAGMLGLAEETLDANDVDANSVVEAAQSPSLGGGIRFIVIRDAHLLKDTESLEALLGPRAAREELMSVCVFLSKDLDGRKKFSKVLTEKAAVVACDEVQEEEREAWIDYLAKRRGLSLPPALNLQLRTLDPWNLDIIDQELGKYELAGAQGDVLLDGLTLMGGADEFLDAFLGRNLAAAMERVSLFADQPDEALPLLGLLGWNVRQLALVLADRRNGTRNAKLNPYIAERMQKWAARWSLKDVVALQNRLMTLDFSMKQTPLLPLGLWTELVSEFCGKAA